MFACRVQIDLDQLVATADSTVGVEKVPNRFERDGACSTPYLLHSQARTK